MIKMCIWVLELLIIIIAWRVLISLSFLCFSLTNLCLLGSSYCMPQILIEWIIPLRSSCENNKDKVLNHPIWTPDEFYMKFQSLEHFFKKPNQIWAFDLFKWSNPHYSLSLTFKSNLSPSSFKWSNLGPSILLQFIF